METETAGVSVMETEIAGVDVSVQVREATKQLESWSSLGEAIGEDTPVATGPWPFVGTAVFSMAGPYQILDVTLDFASGDKLSYKATTWGLGFGAGVSVGGGVSAYSPAELIGAAGATIIVTPGIMGFVSITFWKGWLPCASFSGAALAGGFGGAGGGNGEFKRR